jgi:hypothetical protein
VAGCSVLVRLRAASTAQFANAFAKRLGDELTQRGELDFRSNFTEEETFQPIKVTARYNISSDMYVWRAFSFASQSDAKKQLTLAKAIYAENAELRHLPKYRDAHFSVAVQLPKPQARSDWYKAVKWLGRTSEHVIDLEERQSLEAKIPDVLSVA